MTQATSDQWATVDLMGHAQTAGRITMENGLLRVDVPGEGDEYRTEFYGMAAIYSIKVVSEEIARAYMKRSYTVEPFDTPIVTREHHIKAMNELEQKNNILRHTVRELENQLTSVRALPATIESEQPNETGE